MANSLLTTLHEYLDSCLKEESKEQAPSEAEILDKVISLLPNKAEGAKKLTFELIKDMERDAPVEDSESQSWANKSLLDMADAFFTTFGDLLGEMKDLRLKFAPVQAQAEKQEKALNDIFQKVQ